MITPQNPLTVISPVIPGKLEELREILNNIQHPHIDQNTLVPFPKFDSVHFARFVIMEGGDRKYPVQLAFSLNYDGYEGDLLQELVREARPGLTRIYDCCEGFAGNLENYWRDHRIKVPAFYNGHRGMSLKQIRQEDTLQQAIANYLDQEYRTGTVKNKTAAEVKDQVSNYFRSAEGFHWAVKDKGLSNFQKKLYQRKEIWIMMAIFLAVVFGLGILLGKVLDIWWFFGLILALVALGLLAGIPLFLMKQQLNKLEATDPSEIETADTYHVNRLMNAENFQVQNQLTHLVELKPGSLRLKTLKLVLGAVNFLARTLFNKGELGGIPSIHFARWIITDNNKRLLFFSNFDGSWENYLGDFVDKASKGLTGVWSNTVNFPRARNLLFEGARDEQRFKEWARHLQIPTQVWYTAYKTLSVQNINNNAAIRAGLFRKMNEADSQLWLDRIHQFQR